MFPELFHGRIVVDIGSLDINGNNRGLFEDCLYLGIDVSPGANVDIATPGHLLALPDASVDVVISTEAFEHDVHYADTLRNCVRMLKPGGLFLFTCATSGRPEHGTRRTTPQDAPLLADFAEWSDYYRNLDENDIRAAIDVGTLFPRHGFAVNQVFHDLYFWGIKQGTDVRRDNYSFLIPPRTVPYRPRLYYSVDGESFSDANTVFGVRSGAGDPLALHFALPESAAYVRIDPVEIPALLEIEAIRGFDRSGAPVFTADRHLGFDLLAFDPGTRADADGFGLTVLARAPDCQISIRVAAETMRRVAQIQLRSRLVTTDAALIDQLSRWLDQGVCGVARRAAAQATESAQAAAEQAWIAAEAAERHRAAAIAAAVAAAAQQDQEAAHRAADAARIQAESAESRARAAEAALQRSELAAAADRAVATAAETRAAEALALARQAESARAEASAGMTEAGAGLQEAEARAAAAEASLARVGRQVEAAQGEVAASRAEVARLRAEAEKTISESTQTLAAARQERDACRAELAALAEEKARILASRSWRITGPLRRLGRALGRHP